MKKDQRENNGTPAPVGRETESDRVTPKEHPDLLKELVLARVRVHREHIIVRGREPHALEESLSAERAFGLFVWAAMQRREQTLQDVSEELGVKYEFIQWILNGELPGWTLSDETISRLARAIGYNPEVLFALIRKPNQ